MIFFNKTIPLVFILGILLVGCSSTTKNQITQNQFFLREGVYKHQKWSDHLSFKRTSWFQELSMLFDVMVGEIDQRSPFYNWFSDFEKNEIKKCDHFILILSYAFSDTRLSDGMFVGELRKSDYKLIEIPGFKDNLKLHPDYLNELLEHYKVRGACKNSSSSSDFLISFPGYNPVKII